MMSQKLTHLNEEGHAKMVDVSQKQESERVAVARGSVVMKPDTLQRIIEGNLKKGDVLTVAQLAGVMAAKRTSDLIPLCHPLLLTHIEVDCRTNVAESRVDIEATVRLTGKTGVEMEALTAVATTALTIYDMAKAIDRTMHITNIHLAHKSGGRSGIYNVDEAADGT
ncbi:MAG: cyclic pyranopterin monophosphate synthase MoaC [Chloroflexi bacterium]|nr:cyclic pyranopterin monophosphate synthase MoaC [Chloroflexota bacterium]